MVHFRKWIGAAAAGGLVLAGSLVASAGPALATDAATPVTIVEKLTGPD